MNSRSIRFRLTIWYSLALIAGLIFFALAIWISMRESLMGDVRQLLTGELANSRTYVESELREPDVELNEELSEFSAAFSPGSYLRVVNAQGVVIFDSNSSFPWPSARSRVQWNGKPFMVLVSRQPIGEESWTFAVSASLEQVESILNQLRILLLISIPLIVLIASVGGRWLSRRALKPVDEMTEAARRIGAANLSERLPVPQTGDELERFAKTWNSMLERLEESLKRLSRFTADASHELRTLLAIIRTTAELAARRPRPAEVYRDALNQVMAESERLTRLLDDLLCLARVDAEVVEMPHATFDLARLVGDLCLQINSVAAAKQLRICYRRSDESALVLGNEGAIRRLILALLDNAVKYSPTDSEVHVSLKNVANQISLEVIDSGPGIAESDLPLIFQRFYRGDHPPHGAQEGSGLGLSLAAGLADRNNARIEVASHLGTGSTFRVLFHSAG
jgi:signal transduction histidine kinase